MIPYDSGKAILNTKKYPHSNATSNKAGYRYNVISNKPKVFELRASENHIEGVTVRHLLGLNDNDIIRRLPCIFKDIEKGLRTTGAASCVGNIRQHQNHRRKPEVESPAPSQDMPCCLHTAREAVRRQHGCASLHSGHRIKRACGPFIPYL